ncbi:hypothetical protein LPJ66_011236, partial [Kickxella alabastrina]
MASVIAKSHGEFELGRLNTGSTPVPISLRNQRRDPPPATPTGSAQEPRRRIRHSRSFSSIDYTAQDEPDMHEARGQPEPIKETGRARAQRRKTGGLADIGHQRRPSTAHGSPASKKVMYSQYPDFENITDPFAKRDKIPRKHRPS